MNPKKIWKLVGMGMTAATVIRYLVHFVIAWRKRGALDRELRKEEAAESGTFAGHAGAA